MKNRISTNKKPLKEHSMHISSKTNIHINTGRSAMMIVAPFLKSSGYCQNGIPEMQSVQRIRQCSLAVLKA